MNDAHLHLVLNHLPIIIPIIGLLVMLGGFIFRSEAVKQTAYFIFILGAITTFPTFKTGGGAKEVVEHLQGVEKKFIKTHIQAAKTFAMLSYALGVFSLLGIWANYKQKSFSNILSIATMVFSIIVLFFAKQTGTTGGEIRHLEIRKDFKPPNKNKENTEKSDSH
ncbi:hypothetical protein FEDK69T_17670 [Flavobacterium enshiense DK69]|uniref:hypothetical protein n=1 Tax=Flavobacterium enshiense TaxID=1341165 RepID=UPI0003C5D01E|nr:hypothetical protein [Flavobacterium enshiense]ESU22864.1 hypothetical protein FEDK69T_17670 [Flavobacterium enshiense DK69]